MTAKNQKTPLPLVFFRCEDMKATLTTRTCVAQYKAANGGEATKKQAGYTPHAKRLGCMGCPIGKAHSKGTPTPPELLVDAPTVRVERIALPMKVCSGCLKPFTPLDKKQRHCSPDCDPEFAPVVSRSETMAPPPTPNATPASRYCAVCTEEFPPRTPDQVYCCDDCAPVGQEPGIPEREPLVRHDEPVGIVPPSIDITATVSAPVSTLDWLRRGTERTPASIEGGKPEEQPKETSMASFSDKKCAECGETFTPESARSTYCDPECKKAALDKRLAKARPPKREKKTRSTGRGVSRLTSQQGVGSRRVPKASPTAALRAAAADITVAGERSMVERILAASGFTVVESMPTPRGRLLIIEEVA